MDNPPEAVKAMARRIVARAYRARGWPQTADRVETGVDGGGAPMIAAITAIVETSELCAKLADKRVAELLKADADRPQAQHRHRELEASLIVHMLRQFRHLPETPHED
jgi:hypothetical protein